MRRHCGSIWVGFNYFILLLLLLFFWCGVWGKDHSILMVPSCPRTSCANTVVLDTDRHGITVKNHPSLYMSVGFWTLLAPVPFMFALHWFGFVFLCFLFCSFFVLFCLRQNLKWPRNLLRLWGCSWTCDPPASAFGVLGLRTCPTKFHESSNFMWISVGATPFLFHPLFILPPSLPSLQSLHP